MISQYFFRHQGVAPYESEDAPGKEKPTRPLTSRNLKITLRSNADTVSSRKVKRENALKAALPRTPGSHEQTGVPITFAASTNRRFEFYKRRQLFIGVHNETLSVAAMRC
jgi:hypothetical protein